MTDQEIENLSLLDLYKQKSEANKKMKKTKAGQLHKRLDDSWKKRISEMQTKKKTAFAKMDIKKWETIGTIQNQKCNITVRLESPRTVAIVQPIEV